MPPPRRYHADLSTRGNRLQQLQDSFFKQQAVSPGPGRAPVMPLTAEQKDMAQAGTWFQGLGWQVDEAGEKGEERVRRRSQQSCAAKLPHNHVRPTDSLSGHCLDSRQHPGGHRHDAWVLTYLTPPIARVACIGCCCCCLHARRRLR